MTVIAWDGRTLAADRRAVVGGHTYTMTKIHRVGDALVGVAGRGDKIAEFRQWIADGRKRETYPVRTDAAWFTAIVILPGGVIERFEDQSLPIVVEDAHHAIGTGRDYARVAMHLGKTAREAVEIACLFDENCGNGVDTLTLTGDSHHGKETRTTEEQRHPCQPRHEHDAGGHPRHDF